jgi:hypothetical protein
VLADPPEKDAPRDLAEATAPAVVYPTLPLATRLLACILGFIVPGAGHMLIGRFTRGLIFLACVVAMFVVGLSMQGRFFTLTNSTDWLSKLFSVFDAGLGLTYFVCWGADWFTKASSLAPTFEYGNTFIMVAGLLNYLIVLDAYDIAVGRKG